MASLWDQLVGVVQIASSPKLIPLGITKKPLQVFGGVALGTVAAFGGAYLAGAFVPAAGAGGVAGAGVAGVGAGAGAGAGLGIGGAALAVSAIPLATTALKAGTAVIALQWLEKNWWIPALLLGGYILLKSKK